LFFELKDIKSQNVKNRFLLVKKSMKNITALKLSSVWFSQSFVFGLSLGLIPLTIKNVLGSSYISILLPLFYIMPTLFSYFFGKSSDQKGRGKIIYLSYALGISGLISLYLSTKLSLVIGVVLLALSLASIKIITLALPGDISEDHNLDFLTGLFWVIQNIGVLGALILSRFIQSNAAYLISLIIMLLSLGILLSVFKTNFSREKFQEIKLKLSEQIK
jgi:MFS family permease